VLARKRACPLPGSAVPAVIIGAGLRTCRSSCSPEQRSRPRTREESLPHTANYVQTNSLRLDALTMTRSAYVQVRCAVVALRSEHHSRYAHRIRPASTKLDSILPTLPVLAG
jgi:hypothetical protein